MAPRSGYELRSLSSVHSSSSTVPLDPLLSLSSLHTWVHRPQAVAACFVSDVYELRAISEDNGTLSSTSRDVFLLNKFPCKHVELVGWVAGVDQKETKTIITLDDGDGENVIQVVVHLASVQEVKRQSHEADHSSPTRQHFVSAKDRRIARKQAATTEMAPATLPLRKVFLRPSLHVGDTVRVVGRVDDWVRRRSDGQNDWMRQILVDESTGAGLVTLVDSDEQYLHVTKVLDLHQSVYSIPFIMPTINPPTPVQSSPAKSVASSVEPSGEFIEVDRLLQAELREPSKLSTSRLTETTFKFYLLDHMTRETARILRSTISSVSTDGSVTPIPDLAYLFPEYGTTLSKHRLCSPKADIVTANQHDKTPRPNFRSRAEREAALANSLSQRSHLKGFTVASLMRVDHLHDLAIRVVDTRAKHEEKLRRRRARDGVPTARDLEIVAKRRARGLESSEYRLSAKERDLKMIRLTEWAIRQAAESGGVVQVSMGPSSGSETPSTWKQREAAVNESYLPLIPELMLPLLVALLAAERAVGNTLFLPRGDPRRTPGIDTSTLISRLRAWGEDGRWERVGDWVVAEALGHGENLGILRADSGRWCLTS